MERLTHERLNGIRDGYWSPNKKQELVDRLAAYENTNLDPEQVKHVKETAKKYLLEKAQGKVGGWIPVEERLPEDGTDVLVVLKPTYESDYIEYSIARYLRFENDEAHWCDNHYGYLEWEKYSDGHGGSSWYRVVAWQKLDSYHPERSDNHDGE